ncbi:hypothetical protein QE152_g9852 [Popillia japonica]|uniref:Reverse transcriptase domain-containing protein n=1 Tax=Popillia japonica TaxID=7064 RepID=A0AAW1LVD9_POPJA
MHMRRPTHMRPCVGFWILLWMPSMRPASVFGYCCGCLRCVLCQRFQQRTMYAREEMDNSGGNTEGKRMDNSGERLLDTTKRNYYTEKISNSRNKARTVWDIVNEETCGKRRSRRPVIFESRDGGVIADAQEIAGEFREHFSVCVTRLVADTFGAYFEGPCTGGASVSSSLVVLDVTPSEVECVFGTMKCDASPGLDGLLRRLLKGCSESLLEVVAYLINVSLGSAVFLDVLKLGAVVPVLKRGSAMDVTNYRPVTVLSALSHIFEKIVYSRLSNFLDKYNIVSSRQHGFRRGRSTETALAEMMSFVCCKLDSSRQHGFRRGRSTETEGELCLLQVG